MLLSKAIREGAKLRPQGFGYRFDGKTSCALEAALEAATGRTDATPPEFHKHFGVRWRGRFDCPAEGCALHANRISLITHLNDSHQWTRERIADWVATVENADA